MKISTILIIMALEAITLITLIAVANHPFATGFFSLLLAFGWWQMGVAMAYNEQDLRK